MYKEKCKLLSIIVQTANENCKIPPFDTGDTNAECSTVLDKALLKDMIDWKWK